MIVSIFKKNLFFNSLLLLPFAVILRLYSLVFAGNIKTTEVGGILYTSIINILPDYPILNSIVSIILVFIEAVMINRLVIKNRFSRDITLLPGMFFIVLVSLSPEMLGLSPIIFGLYFVILSFSNLFKTYKKYNSERYLFNAGMFMGVAILFYFNFILLTIPLLIGLLSIKAFKIREVLQVASGFLIVLYIYAFWMYWSDTPIIYPKMNIYSIIDIAKGDIFKYIIFGIYFFLIINTIFTYRQFVIKKSIQSQKKINILFFLLIFSVFTIILIAPIHTFNYLYLLAFPISFFTSVIFTRIKNNLILEVVNLVVIFAILIYHFQFFR